MTTTAWRLARHSASPPLRVLVRRTHTADGRFVLDLSLASIEASFGGALIRVHRNWLVNAAHIKELHRDGNDTRIFVGAGIGKERKGVFVPVARERTHAIRERLLADATGLRETAARRV